VAEFTAATAAALAQRFAAAGRVRTIRHDQHCPVCAQTYWGGRGAVTQDCLTPAWNWDVTDVAPQQWTVSAEPAPFGEWAAACEKAQALLDAHLSDEQRACRKENGCIPVTGSAGGRYRIYLWHTYNIMRVDADGTETHKICAGPRADPDGRDLPPDDYWLAQMLALRSDEHGFLARANVATKTGGFIGHGPVWEREQERGLWRARLDELERERTALHHIDGNPRNNVPANLRWVQVNRPRFW
jgi:hypothetical protein